MSTTDCRLAIVIPAYKSTYLEDTLFSLSLQTCKNFHLYIGDDHSPYPIKNIVDKFTNKLDIQYFRFEENLGGKDLVAQWERCIKLTSEPWIWLFSDDDYVDSNCVQSFYEIQKKHQDIDLFRFNVNIVNNKKIILSSSVFPQKSSSDFLFRNKAKGRLNCFAVEFIFSRNIYKKKGGFQKFDLAWGTDTATWMKFGLNGIGTIPDAYVYWRSSGENITTQNNSDFLIRKLKASNSFLLWAKKFYNTNIGNCDTFIDYIFIKRIVSASDLIPLKKCISISDDYLGNGLRRFFLICFIHLYHFLIKLRKFFS